MRHHRLTLALFAGSAAILFAGCDAPGRVVEPPRLSASGAGDLSLSAATHPVELLDQCDPDSFNALVGPGTCLSTHSGITFPTLIQQLTEHQTAPAWRNAPSMMSIQSGATIVAINRGGEVHTFTRVAAFGGGVVPQLNALAGTPTPAPECLAAPPSEFLPPGGKDAEAVTGQGTEYYQCCIHPWMRTVVSVK